MPNSDTDPYAALIPKPTPRAAANPYAALIPKAPAAQYDATSRVDALASKSGLKDTSGYRSPQKENRLRSQGAGTVAPGRTSDHSRGSSDAPGAHDFVPSGGESMADALARTQKMPGVRRAFMERAQGGQGQHIHASMANDPYAALIPKGRAGPDNPYAALVPKGPAMDMKGGPATPAAMDKFAHPPQLRQGPSRLGEYVGGVLQGARQGFDRRGLSKEALANESDPTGARDALSLAGHVTGGVAGAVSGAVKPLLEPHTSDRVADETQARTNREHPNMFDPKHVPTGQNKADLVGTIAAGIAPIGDAGLGAKAAKEAPAFMRMAEGGGKEIIGTEADTAERMSNALTRAGGKAKSGRLQAMQAFEEADPAHTNNAIQEEVLHANEQKLINPKAKIPKHLQQAEALRAPWAERQRVATNDFRKLMQENGMSEEGSAVEEFAPDTGYVPRRVQGKSPGIDPLDPEAESRGPLDIRGQGVGKSLSKYTGSQRSRTQFVLEDSNGKRQFIHNNEDNAEWKPGETREDPVHGTGQVKLATVREIEAAGARGSDGKPLAYNKNALVNTMDDALKSERVLDNAKILTGLLKDPKLAYRTKLPYPVKLEDGTMHWTTRPNPAPRPDGWREVPNIPQLKGHLLPPEVAEVMEDYRPNPNDLDKTFGYVNRLLNASLFITPIPHIKNVAVMGFVGRGGDWLPGTGAYGRLERTSREAIREVTTFGPKFHEFLQEGAGLRSADEPTAEFYDKMMKMASEQIAGDPKIPKAMGININPVDLARAAYGASHKALWTVNDIIMFQRYLELTGKGLSKREAIRETEKWIANYRVPTRVAGKRWASQAFQNSNVLNFGRYGYGKWRTIGEMAKGVTSADPQERMSALGKIVALGVLSKFVYPVMDEIGRNITGNPNAKVTRSGELAPIDALTDKEKDWASKTASVLDVAPLNDVAMEGLTNRNSFTGKHTIEPGSSKAGMEVQGAEAVAEKVYPAALAMEAMQPGGVARAAGRLAGVSLPTDKQMGGRAKAAKYNRYSAKSRAKRDPIEQALGVR